MNPDELKASEEERKNAFIQLPKRTDHLIDVFKQSFKEKNRGVLIVRTFSFLHLSRKDIYALFHD